jgi:3-deoxy-manno-octulosonate cytidylyltransferase (CMP-KDO synthetase)
VIERRGWGDDVVVVNLQGDEPAMPSVLLDQVAGDLAGILGSGMSTLASPIRDRATLFDPHAVKVVTDAQGYALYFSRAPIPWHRDEFLGNGTELPTSVGFLRHIGLYAYRAGFLKRYLTWAPIERRILEQLRSESLEQLRGRKASRRMKALARRHARV